VGWGQGEAEEERGGCEIPHKEGSRLEGIERNASIFALLFLGANTYQQLTAWME